MATMVTQINSPAEMGVGEVALLEALLSGDLDPASMRCVSWSVQEFAGAPARPLGRGPNIGYVAPSYAAPATGGKSAVTVLAHTPGGPTVASEIQIKALRDYVLPTENKPLAVKVLEPLKIHRGRKAQRTLHRVEIGGMQGAMLVGYETTFAVKGKTKEEYNKGLALAGDDCLCTYSPDAYRQEFGAWANVIAPTALCEGNGGLEALNTYDTATFSFGLIQFAANSYGADFYVFLKRLFQSKPDLAALYFPDLQFNGEFTAVDSVDRTKTIPLTSARTSDKHNPKLRQWIKPVANAVTDQEVDFAARLIHWLRSDSDVRSLVVQMAVERAKVNFANPRLVDSQGKSILDGKDIGLCSLIFDILVQGRGSMTAKARHTSIVKLIVEAVLSSDPMAYLAAICDGPNVASERRRVNKELLPRINDMSAAVNLKYDSASQTFVAK